MEIALFLKSSPYSGGDAATALSLAGAALEAGHKVTLIASGDGIYCFLKEQKAKGVPNAGERFGELMKKGLRAYL